jgi:hypothetical protein
MGKASKRKRDQGYEFDFVQIPEQWYPPGDRIDSEGFNRWVEQQIAATANPQRWTAGMLVHLNELQIKQAVERGSRLIEIDSPLPPGWTSTILDAAIERLERQGFEIPSLMVSCESGGVM